MVSCVIFPKGAKCFAQIKKAAEAFILQILVDIRIGNTVA